MSPIDSISIVPFKELYRSYITTSTPVASLIMRGHSARSTIWGHVLNRMVGLPVIYGYGLSADPSFSVGDTNYRHPHSLFVASYFYGGAIGLILLFLLLLKTVWVTSSHCDFRQRHLAFVLFCYGLIVLLPDGNRIIDKIGFVWMTFWFPVGVAMGFNFRKEVLDETSNY